MRRFRLDLAVFLLAAPALSAASAQSPDSTRARVTQSGRPMAAHPDSVAAIRDAGRKAMDIFGDSLAPAPDSQPGVADEPRWDIDVRSYETRDRVAHFVSVFTGRARERVTQWLERGSRYEPMIRAKLRAGGLPEDMYYLALVESGFDPHAYSRAAAVGMWQFMTSTARDMGLRVDPWVDERRDPVRSTGAAVRFIRGLRDQFGSLYLAAAAYNGGPGRVARGMARYADEVSGASSEDAFFVLADNDYLRTETRDYVPQLIAAALIAKEPGRYGLELRQQAPFTYDSVTVPAATPLAAVARASNADVSAIMELNPQFLRGMTPPSEPTTVRVPVGAASRFDSLFALQPREARVATRSVTTRKGDTPERVAHANGISIAALRAFNPKARVLKSGRYALGQSLVAPTPAVAAATRFVPDPDIERYSSASKHSRVHTVARGETVAAIARRFGTTPERLMKLNGLKKPMIFPGQALIVSSSRKATKKGAGKSPSAPKHGGGKKKKARKKAS